MNRSNGIPFLDLVTPHAELKAELCEVFETALETAGFIGGPMVQGLRRTSPSSARRALRGSGQRHRRVAIRSDRLGIGQGDVVVTVPNTFIATTEAISQAGARPEFVDIDEATYNLDPGKLREYIEAQCDFDRETGTLIGRRSGGRVSGHHSCPPVRANGGHGRHSRAGGAVQPAVIEDACQAHGAEYFSKKKNRW